MFKEHSRANKAELKRQKKLLKEEEIISEPFMILIKTKLNKADGFDEIYPELIKYFSPGTREWLFRFYSDILNTSNIPKHPKSAKVLALVKPGKSRAEAADYRPISLLSIPFKIFERLILERKRPYIEKVIPVEKYVLDTIKAVKDKYLP